MTRTWPNSINIYDKGKEGREGMRKVPPGVYTGVKEIEVCKEIWMVSPASYRCMFHFPNTETILPHLSPGKRAVSPT